MSFTSIDFLVSIPITAIIIFVIKWIYKKTSTEATPMGCLFGCGIMYWFVLCAVSGYNQRLLNKKEAHLTKVTLVSSREIAKIPNTEFVGADTSYIHKAHVYKNDTGRELVSYMVKYSIDGADSSEPIGTVIKPGKYFYWYDEDDDYRMFETPPSSTTVVYHSRYGRNHKLDFTYLHFLDYADNVEGKVRMIR